ncbi:MAG: ABC transporter ATP-binding protein [Chloroflexi bacterium]|nr:ABC transporter ATP-binding protein [Chloroflexota bacterium]
MLYPRVETSLNAGVDPAIVVDSLVKCYSGQEVVASLSFTVRRGEVFALLGPNGAGKTTTVEILEGYCPADAGAVHVLGLNPRREARALKQRIGVVLQQGGIYPQATPQEMLSLFARFYAHPARVDELLELAGLVQVARTRFRRLSGGQQRRLALALALVGNPDLVFLDEPTSGMDPQGRQLTWQIVSQLRERGVTVLLTTHYMEEAQRLADHIAIIDHGKLLAFGTPRELLRGTSDTTTVVRLRLPHALPPEQLRALSLVRTVRELDKGGYQLEVENPAAALAELTAWLRDHQVVLDDLRVGQVTLEDVFLQLTGRDLRE